MINPGDVLSYLEMCQEEGCNLQRGMNFKLKGQYSVILMSLRKGAPYADRIEENGRVLIYEGHDIAKTKGTGNPKAIDQPQHTPTGRLTQNGLFYEAALQYKNGKLSEPVAVKVYEKIHAGIWTYNGIFQLVDAWLEASNGRQVFKYRLKIMGDMAVTESALKPVLDNDRLIPSAVKLAVWKRDQGHCIKCGSEDNLHFDHIIPYSKGGSSLVAENIQILCARHNLEKSDRIQ